MIKKIITGITVFMAMMLMALGSVTSAEETNLAATLQKCSNALDSAEKVFQTTNVSNLPVLYRYGLLIERTRTRAQKYIGMARKDLQRLKKETTVSGVLLLVTDLRGLEADTELMGNLLIGTLNNSGNQEKLVAKLVDMFSDVSNNLSEAVNNYEDAAYNFAENIDDELQQCRLLDSQ